MFIYLLVTENKEIRWALENVDSNQSEIYLRKQRCHYTSPDGHVTHHRYGKEVRGKPCWRMLQISNKKYPCCQKDESRNLNINNRKFVIYAFICHRNQEIRINSDQSYSYNFSTSSDLEIWNGHDKEQLTSRGRHYKCKDILDKHQKCLHFLQVYLKTKTVIVINMELHLNVPNDYRRKRQEWSQWFWIIWWNMELFLNYLHHLIIIESRFNLNKKDKSKQ